ncbi:MAG: hypothetical protein JW809_13320 [Pirellulales bacterium]|nr:hypothetical protein [Pirellulales bacterium]
MLDLGSSARGTRWGAVVAIALVLATAGAARGGGGPENLLLVVNSRSSESLAVANAYARLRGVPPINVVYVPWDPKKPTTDVESFREEILRPVLDAINRRRLTNQIDYVAYSSGFPWEMDLEGDVKRFLDELPSGKKPEWPKILTKRGSLSGLTYLWQAVMAREVEYVGLSANRYMRVMDGDRQKEPTMAFHGRLQFDPAGKTVASGGRSYLLSIVLGEVANEQRRGNTLGEAMQCLERSAAADGTRPRGTIYYAANGKIRSTVREPLFPTAVKALGELGVTAEIVRGDIPNNRADVQGVMMGVDSFDWARSGSAIRPGAIADNLTSSGGVMTPTQSQTCLTDYIRYGAAGSSGTVFEPFAIPPKFPSPMIHVHYARGCSLAEAFYQSVHGPYQLLIVGDPLCQPWARLPEVSVAGVEPGATVRGTVALEPSATLDDGQTIDHFELFVDGLLAGRAAPGEKMSFDSALLADGRHELRVVGVGPAPICSRGRAVLAIQSANHDRSIEAACDQTEAPLGGTLTVTASCPGASRIGIYQNHRLVGGIDGAEGKADVPTSALGLGPVRLEVLGYFNAPSPKDRVAAAPIDVTIQVPGNKK